MLLMCLVACSAVAAMLAAQNPAAANIHMLTPDEMMDIGLRLETYSARQIRESGLRATLIGF